MSQSRNQLSSTLAKFYKNPVAAVSTELFLSIGAVVFFGLFAIRPTLLTMSDLVKQIEDKRELKTKLDQKVAALSTAQSQYFTLESRMSLLDEAIPSNPNLLELLPIIEKLASEQEIVISRLNVREIPEDIDQPVPFSQLQKQEVQIVVTVLGDYPSIKDYVQKILESRRIMTIESVTFSLDQNRDSKQLQARITINAPYYGKSNAKSVSKTAK